MSLINKSYFIGPLTIAQLGHNNVVNNLTTFIERFEAEVLQAAMGYDLYKAFIDGLDVGSDEEIAQKWLDLRDGKVFTTQSSIKKQWNGIANASTKRSIIAPVIYTEILRDEAITKTGIGTAVAESENTVSISPDLKITTAWFKMRQDIFVLWEFLMANQTVYTEYKYSQINFGYFGSQNQFGI